ncbi:MAG: ABC transporter ATP-binding protein [Phycisphaeraceae bacterium]|nr:ABC transporter ATP-binding protein [Phycisphaeraceae bacterium]
MLRHRGLFAASLLFAVLSAGGLGAGLLGLGPILKNILPAPGAADAATGLRAMAQGQQDKLAQWGLHIPTAWIEALPTDRYTSVVWVVVALGVLTVIGAACNFLHAFCSLTVVSRVIATIRRDAFRKAVHLPLKTVVGTGTADVVSRIVYDTATLGSGFNALLSKVTAQVSKGIAALIAAFILDWRLTLVAMFVAPGVAIVIRKLGKRIRRASRSALQSLAGLYLAAGETLGGLRVVKVYTSERTEAGRFHRINKEVVRQEMRVRTARAISSPLIETLTIFVLGALALVAAKQIIDGGIDPRNFLLVFGSLGMAAAQLRPLTGFMNDVQQSSAAADRLAQLLAHEPEPGHGRGPDGKRLPTLARHSRSIEFRGVTFSYPAAAAPALSGVNLRIEYGQTVAVVGPNGSGKTTLLSLVPRLFDADLGEVLIDGTDVRSVSVRSLRRQIGVVTQEVVLFQGTIRENIAYGADGEASDEEVHAAARRARAEEFILKKPGGYGWMLGEGGGGLSGGQRQRLSIARAILRDPAILILDEATSMVDADSESKIAEALTEFVRGGADRRDRRTCLIVAHRLSTVVNADVIVVMDQGQIVDQGRHDELLARCATYRLIAQTQLLRPPPEPPDTTQRTAPVESAPATAGA